MNNLEGGRSHNFELGIPPWRRSIISNYIATELVK